MGKISLKGIDKMYPGGVHAVKNMDLEIEDRSFVVFVGPSGCGKSTVLRMIAGLEEISSGDLFIDYECVNKVLPKDRNLSMVFQSYALFPHLTVFENIALGLRLRKVDKRLIRDKVNDVALSLELSDVLKRKPRALSGGQQQRVALARAMVKEPNIFLMDEPLSNLDAKLRVQMRSEIIELYNKLNKTFIYVTHDQVEAMTMGTHIVVMNDGVIQQVDVPMALYENPINTFVAGFIGTPQMNFVRILYDSETGSLTFLDISCKYSLTMEQKYKLNRAQVHSGVYILGIRPEHFMYHMKQDALSLTGIVKMVEQLGAESIIYLDVNGTALVLKYAHVFRGHRGEALTFYLDIDQTIWFDSITEKQAINWVLEK